MRTGKINDQLRDQNKHHDNRSHPQFASCEFSAKASCLPDGVELSRA
jgi:hypothetical protein